MVEVYLVTNLGLKSLKRPRTGHFHFLYWEINTNHYKIFLLQMNRNNKSYMTQLRFTLVISLVLAANFSFGQGNTVVRLTKISIDPNLTSILYKNENNPIKVGNGVSVTVRTNEVTGKKDTIVRSVSNFVRNCVIDDTGRWGHYMFDTCLAMTFLGTDTLILQFQNHNIDQPKMAYWDRLLVHIVGDRFYAEYVYTSKSPYRLKVINQSLILKKNAKKPGERLRGELIIL